MTPEEQRLEESRQRIARWKRWGPYLSERQLGTVKEDYSAEGTPWLDFPHDHARSREDPAYEDVASKFLEHFVYITQAMNKRGGQGISFWDGQDGFYYDVLHLPDGSHYFLKVRSMVGLVPLFAVETLEAQSLAKLPGFTRRLQWFLDNVPHVPWHIEMAQASRTSPPSVRANSSLFKLSFACSSRLPLRLGRQGQRLGQPARLGRGARFPAPVGGRGRLREPGPAVREPPGE
jgi:hypothetical protein